MESNQIFCGVIVEKDYRRGRLSPESLVAKPATKAACVDWNTVYLFYEAEGELMVIPNLRRVLHPQLL